MYVSSFVNCIKKLCLVSAYLLGGYVILYKCYIGCVRLASLGRPRCVTFSFSQDERVQIITHVRPGKKNATHRGRPREAKRTHPLLLLLLLFSLLHPCVKSLLEDRWLWKRPVWTSCLRRLYSTLFFLLKRSRVYCLKRYDHTGSFHTPFKYHLTACSVS